MLPSYRVGKTRIELAQILSGYLGEYVAPALIQTNHEGKNSISHWLGWECSWSVRVGPRDVLSNLTMSKFVRLVNSGGEIFSITNGNQVELLIDTKSIGGCSNE